MIKAATLGAALVGVGLATVGFPALLFSVALLGGAVLWYGTTLRRPVYQTRVIVPYLMTVCMFVLHVPEEYLGHIELALTRLSGSTVSQTDFLILAAFFAPTFWLVGGILMLRRSQLGDYIASVFYFGMVAGEASHFAFSFMEDGTFHYTAGMVSAVPLIGSAVFALRATLLEMRRGRASS